MKNRTAVSWWEVVVVAVMVAVAAGLVAHFSATCV